MYDVIALGELLVDFTNNGTSDQGNMLFEANPGGAPCNVLAILAKLGKKTAFIGKVGNDMFGAMLKGTIERVGISSKELKVDKNVNTTLAFVHTFPDGDRAFSFYRNPGADMMLTEDEVDDTFVQSTKIFHFGTLSMTHENVRNATKKAVKAAKKNGSLISFDPNLREPLWESLEEAKKQMEYGFEQCDILKISDNEIQFITGIEDDSKLGFKIENFSMSASSESGDQLEATFVCKDITIQGIDSTTSSSVTTQVDTTNSNTIGQTNSINSNTTVQTNTIQ